MSPPEPDQATESVRPLIVGRYRLEDDTPLGNGATGEVWRATDSALNRLVALKKIHLDGITEHAIENVKQQTLREGHTIARLHHPHVVAIHDVVTDGDRLMLVLEYVESRSADTILAAQGPFPLHVAAKIGIQLAEALTAIHSQGVLHRDITPGNVLIDTGWNAKLTDFGIAQVTIDLQRTTMAESIGASAFMAPEIARGENPTPATDIYGLGATIWTLIEGVPPFHQPGPDNPMRLMHRIATGHPPPPSKAGPLTTALTTMTSSNPTRRPNAAQTRAMLITAAQVVAGQPAGAPTTGPVNPPAPTNPHRPLQPYPSIPSFRAGQHGLIPPGPARPWQAPVPTAASKVSGRRSFVLPAVIISAIVLLGAAIIGTVLMARGTQHPAAAAPPPPPLDKYLPNPGMIDTCPLAKATDYQRFGTTDYELGPWLGSCLAGITLTGGGQAATNIRLISPHPVNGSVEQRGDLKIISEPQFAPDRCRRYIVLPDQNMLAIWTYVTNTTTNPCVFADLGANSVVQQLHTGGIPTTSSPGPVNSLRRQNACQLLTATDAADVPGLDTSQGYPQYANWGCTRGADPDYPTSAPWLEILFQWGSPMIAGPDAEGTLQTIAGRSVFVKPATGDRNFCEAQIVHSNTPQPTGSAIEESISVMVHANGSADQQCQFAVNEATKIISRLPPGN